MSEKSGQRCQREQAAGEPHVGRAPVTHQKRCLFGLGFNFFKDQNNVILGLLIFFFKWHNQNEVVLCVLTLYKTPSISRIAP